MNETSLLNSVLPKLEQGAEIIVPPGDDCAVIEMGTEQLYLMSVDQLVESVHYDPLDTSAFEAAVKLVNRNVSDIAAMGGYPAQALLTIASSDKTESWLNEFFDGISHAASRFNISVCGGDLSSAGAGDFVSTLTITGWVNRDRLCLRSNAEDGDVILCTGELGNSYYSRHHLTFTPRIEAAEFLAGRFTDAMMDISDGLGCDIRRMASASSLGVQIELDKLPLREGADIKVALSDGEDYELLFAVSPGLLQELYEAWPFKDLKLSEIGLFTNQSLGVKYLSDKIKLDLSDSSGYDHFE